MPHLCLHKSAGIKKAEEQRQLLTACLWVQGSRVWFFRREAKNPVPAKSCAACLWVQGPRIWFFRREAKNPVSAKSCAACLWVQGPRVWFFRREAKNPEGLY